MSEVDHLVETRRLAQCANVCRDADALSGYLIRAIAHLADAIEELHTVEVDEDRPSTINPELIGQLEAVLVLLPEHRDRKWLGPDGKTWEWSSELSEWVSFQPKPKIRTFGGYGTAIPGPFTAVEEA